MKRKPYSTRQSCTMAVVPVEERSAVGGLTGVARTTGAPISPLLAEFLFARPSLNQPSVLYRRDVEDRLRPAAFFLRFKNSGPGGIVICRMPQATDWSRGDFRHEDAVVAGDRIYIGFQCKDPDPRHISIQTIGRDETMRRDGATKTDDNVSIIDTYGDRLTGYFFHAERSDRSGAPLDVPALAGHPGSRILVS